jgi:NTE family protein
MTKIANPKDVHYLALEGGGGKGVAFLGAIQALEELGVLPINIDQPSKNQIKGISGSSAGAITAMCLAVGYDSYRLEKLLSDGSKFSAFFDRAQLGNRRIIDGRGNSIEAWDFSDQRSAIQGLNDALPLFPIDIGDLLVWAFGVEASNPVVERFNSQRWLKTLELLFDGGLFCGFPARQFLSGILRDGLLSPFKCLPMTFGMYYDYMGIDLRITGVNVSRGRPMNFSAAVTPDFPLDEAVGISMNLPFVFKPVDVFRSPLWPGYDGFWVDGGLLNNYPLHAFDQPGSTMLNPNVLGLRLTDGYPGQPVEDKPVHVKN